MWLKSLHLFFMVAWLAGLLYLPRLFVNHAMTEDAATAASFKTMERKLYRFTTHWMVLTLVIGVWMLFDYAWGLYGAALWLHIKLALIVALVGYHHWCGRIVKTFAADKNTRSHVWYRWFNEVPAVLLLAIVLLAGLKPF